MTDTKGILATVWTAAGGIVAWLPAVETLLRIGVSAAGIAAGIYAARYWHLKAKKLAQDRGDS